MTSDRSIGQISCASGQRRSADWFLFLSRDLTLPLAAFFLSIWWSKLKVWAHRNWILNIYSFVHVEMKRIPFARETWQFCVKSGRKFCQNSSRYFHLRPFASSKLQRKQTRSTCFRLCKWRRAKVWSRADQTFALEKRRESFLHSI